MTPRHIQRKMVLSYVKILIFKKGKNSHGYQYNNPFISSDDSCFQSFLFKPSFYWRMEEIIFFLCILHFSFSVMNGCSALGWTVEEAFIHRNYSFGILCGSRGLVHIPFQEQKIKCAEIEGEASKQEWVGRRADPAYALIHQWLWSSDWEWHCFTQYQNTCLMGNLST